MHRKTKPKKSWDSEPRPGEKEVNKDRVDTITRKRTFEYFDKPQIGNRFYIFRRKGEEITGRVIGHPIANVKRSSSWPIELDSGEIVEIFGNRELHKALRKCVQQRVRIVYVGKDHTGQGHATKVYRVYTIDREGETQMTSRKRKRKES